MTTEQSSIEYESLKLKNKRLNTFCVSREKAIKSLEDILAELDEIKTLAHNSPALASRVNRRIKIKLIADFYVHPLKAEKQREKLKGELLYIIKSVSETDEMTKTWEPILYDSNQAEKETLKQEVRDSGGQSSRLREEENSEIDSQRATAAQTASAEEPSVGANKNTQKEGV
jgi:oligoribonuclease (3'-5' exoribonuclease)